MFYLLPITSDRRRRKVYSKLTQEEEEESLFKAKAVNGEESYCYRATLVWE